VCGILQGWIFQDLGQFFECRSCGRCAVFGREKALCRNLYIIESIGEFLAALCSLSEKPLKELLKSGTNQEPGRNIDRAQRASDGLAEVFELPVETGKRAR
jgi:hypothetical protein